MSYRYRIISILLFLTISIAAHGESTPPQTAPGAPASQQEQPQTNQTNSASQPTDQPASYNDFSSFDISTPEKATISFINLFNGILPGSPKTDLKTICTKSASPSYQDGCMEVLESRAGYLKSIGRSLQGAMFSHQTSTHLSTPPMQLKASWQEILSFFDGSKKTNNKDMTITLQQSGNDWIIVKVE